MKNINNIIDKLENETQEDKEQIKRALKVTAYVLFDGDESRGKISRKKAIDILGADIFVSGLERSALHWTACRYKDNFTILFDSRKLFEEV